MKCRPVFCCGMSRSGGTAQYQAVKALLEMTGAGMGIGFGVALAQEHPDILEYDGMVAVKKEQPPDWALDLVRSGAAVNVGIYRDPRDVAASLLEFRRRQGEMYPRSNRTGAWDEVWDEVVNAVRWQSAWEEVGGYWARYEEIYPKGWAVEAWRISKHLGLDVAASTCGTIALSVSINRNLDRIEKQGRWIDNKDTMLTKAHIGSERGRPGRGLRRLEDWQIAQVEEAFHEWMEAHGYDPLP